MSIVFGLLTACMFAASALTSSRTTRLIGPYATVAWTMLIGLLLTVPVVIAGPPPTSLQGGNIAWWVVSGAGNVGGLLLVNQAFRVGKVGLIAPVVATEGAIAAVIAAALGESIAPVAAVLLAVLVVGVVIAAIAPDPAPIEHERPVLAVSLATMAAFSFAIALYAAGRLSDELPLGWSLLPGRLVGVIALAIPLVVMRRLNLTRKALPLVLLLGFFEVAGFTFYWFGAQDGVAVTAVLASQFAPIAAVLAFLIFKERLGRLQIVGVAILVAGVTALTLVTG